MKKQIKRKIYLLSKREMRPIEVVQYETGVQLLFEIQDIELDTMATATMFVRKPSGKFVFQEDNISLTGNTVTVDLHNQALAEYGHPFFQIKFKKDEEVISTYSGMLTVDKSLEDSGAEESKTVIAAFDHFTDEQIARIEEATQAQIDLMKAEVEAKGLSVLSTIPEDYTEMFNRVNALYNSVANAIKGFASGFVVRVDDVSPVEHNPVVKVHGKNLFDVSKLPNITGKLTNNNDGTLTIAANMYAVPTGKKITELCPSLKVGDVCRLSFSSTSSNTKYIWLHGANIMLYNGTYTFTEEMLNSEFYLYGFRDTDEGYGNACTISNIQIEKGTTATEYAPYIDPSTVSLKQYGKNLFTSTSERTINGVTLSRVDDYYVLNGTATASAIFHLLTVHLNAGTYTISANNPQHNSKDLALVQIYSAILNYQLTAQDNKVNSTATASIKTADDWQMRIRIEGGVTYNNFIIKPQLELGKVATEYAAYKGANEVTPNADGSVEGLTSLPPTMTLLTDTEGVTIECEYNKDTAKVVDNLTKAVVALGGVV